VRLNSRVTALDVTQEGVTLATRDASSGFSHAILAVAPQHLAALAAAIPALDRSCVAWLATTTNRSPPDTCNTTLHSDWTRLFSHWRMARAIRLRPRQSHGQPGLLAFVASAVTRLSADWLDQADAQLQRITRPGSPRWRRSIVEKQATYACVPGMTAPCPHRHPRLFLAGDYTAGPYPATLEAQP